MRLLGKLSLERVVEMCAFVLTALPLGLYVNVFDFVSNPRRIDVRFRAGIIRASTVSFLKSAPVSEYSAIHLTKPSSRVHARRLSNALIYTFICVRI